MDCGLCHRPLELKTNVILNCDHILHRTCLRQWIEEGSILDGKFTGGCPICNEEITTVCNDNNEPLPDIIPFGPTGEPSLYLAVHAAQGCSTFIKYLNHNNREWLQLVTKELENARYTEQGKELIRDILKEKWKVQKRQRTIIEIVLEAKEMQKRIYGEHRIEERELEEPDSLEDDGDFELVEAPTTSDATASVDDPVASRSSADDEQVCAICYCALSVKRSVTLQPCKHVVHRTCILKWFETFDDRDGHTCVLCRQLAMEIAGTEGGNVYISFPLETKTEEYFAERDRLWEPYTTAKRIRHTNRIRINIFELFDSTGLQRISALKQRKSTEYIADIDEEMDKLRLRAAAFQKQLLILHEKKETERMVARVLSEHTVSVEEVAVAAASADEGDPAPGAASADSADEVSEEDAAADLDDNRELPSPESTNTTGDSANTNTAMEDPLAADAASADPSAAMSPDYSIVALTSIATLLDHNLSVVSVLEDVGPSAVDSSTASVEADDQAALDEDDGEPTAYYAGPASTDAANNDRVSTDTPSDWSAARQRKRRSVESSEQLPEKRRRDEFEEY